MATLAKHGSGEKRIHVAPESELGRLLDQIGDEPVMLEKGGEIYRLVKEDIWAGYDAEAVRDAILKTAGSWADVDIDGMIDQLYRAREQGSRPVTRP